MFLGVGGEFAPRTPSTPAAPMILPLPSLRRLAPLSVAALFLAPGVLVALAVTSHTSSLAPQAAAELPARLSGTGLYVAGSTERLAHDVVTYVPQYPLWSDGAQKRRYVRLPAGTSIDASDPEAWQFPVGTRFWKEFTQGRRVETRMIERTATGWTFASYAWAVDGTDATLAPAEGVPGAAEIRPGLRHDIPSREDCLACHGGRAVPILGMTPLQLSPDRDPLAPHAEAPPPEALDLAGLERKGLLRGLPSGWRERAPRIAARSPRERAVLGYLSSNCATCHVASRPIPDVDLSLSTRLEGEGTSTTPVLPSAVGHASRFRLRETGGPESVRIVPGRPDRSLLLRRMASRHPVVQMPPLGTHAPDSDAVSLLEVWIREDLGADVGAPAAHTATPAPVPSSHLPTPPHSKE